MKILRKGDEFKKLPENSIDEILFVRRLLSQGWNYCPKQVYKDFFKVEPKVKEGSENEDKSKKETKKIIKKRFEKR